MWLDVVCLYIHPSTAATNSTIMHACYSHDEYKGMLKTFKVTYSAKKWRMLFTGIDRNYDGQVSGGLYYVGGCLTSYQCHTPQISIEEFVQFVFPNSMEALVR